MHLYVMRLMHNLDCRECSLTAMLVVESVCTEMHGIASSVHRERLSLPWSVHAGYALDTECMLL
jgi:hypothetical protein